MLKIVKSEASYQQRCLQCSEYTHKQIDRKPANQLAACGAAPAFATPAWAVNAAVVLKVARSVCECRRHHKGRQRGQRHLHSDVLGVCGHASAGAADAAAFQPDEQPRAINVLPRLKESDPFKVLGIPDDSEFEEVQAARNYLVQVCYARQLCPDQAP